MLSWRARSARVKLSREQKRYRAWVAQMVERVLGKDEATGSIPVPGSTNFEGEVSVGKLEFEPRAGVTQR